MQIGAKGAITGVLIGVAFLQWGFAGLLLILALAIAGWLVERWVLPNKASILDWLRSGKQQLKRKA